MNVFPNKPASAAIARIRRPIQRLSLVAIPAVLTVILIQPPDVSAADAAKVIVVEGASGQEKYGEQFRAWSDQWREIGKNETADVTVVGPPASGSSTVVREQLESLVKQHSQSESVLWVVLIGHGTFDGKVAKFNVSGPDFTAAELKEWIGTRQTPTVIVNCSSSSSPFIDRLSGPGRIVVTATKSGFELNFTRFGAFFTEALTGNAGDLDKDEQTSLLEAFLYASREVERSYREAGLLATEHALIDDNGDKKGTQSTLYRGIEPGPKATPAVDGNTARQLHLVPSERELNLSPEARGRRDEIESQIRSLKSRKQELSTNEYYQQLESLLLQQAEVYTGRKVISTDATAVEDAADSPEPPPVPEPAAGR